jgi:hypothetical protein
LITFTIPGAPVGKGKHWTPEQVAFLRENYPKLGKVETARLLGVSVTRVRHKANVLGLKQDRNSEFSKEWQSRAAKSKVGKKRPAQAAVMRENILEKGLHLHTSEKRKQMGVANAAAIARNGHPRGMAGKKHAAETKARIAETSQQRWDAMTDDQRSAFTLKQLKAKAATGTFVAPRPETSWKAGWREVAGRRIYFRSKWEANYGFYLEWLRSNGHIAAWEHEPEVFWFEKIKRGCRSYLPDFRITENDGRVVYHEVKGWMDARSKTKIKRMRIYHPKVVLAVIDSKQYAELRKKVSALVPGWEA